MSRNGLIQVMQRILPSWPEYVIKDWIAQPYKKDTDIKNLRFNILKHVLREGLTPYTTWLYDDKLVFKTELFTDWTRDKLSAGWIGSRNPQLLDLNDDLRYSTQLRLIKENGISRQPVIVIMTGGKYHLLEGWHRTVQNLKCFPQGYVGPAWIAKRNINGAGRED